MPWGKKKSIDDFITRLSQNDPILTSLCVLTSTRAVNAASCTQLSTALRTNTILTELLLSGHTIGSEGAAAMTDALSGTNGNKTLQTLCIGSQQFSDGGVQALASKLGEWNALRELDLELKNIGPKGAFDLGQGMFTNTSLETLNLSRNPLTDEGIVNLLKQTYGGATFTNPQCKLNELQLCETGCSVQSLQLLSNVCNHNSLVTLKLDRNIEIGTSAISSDVLSQFISTTSHIQNLSLANCALGDLGVFKLCQGLSTNISLQNLNLSKNGITVNGIRSLAMSFLKSGAFNVHTLNLNGNVIGAEGACLLAEALSSTNNNKSETSGNSDNSDNSDNSKEHATSGSDGIQQQRQQTIRVLNMQSCKIGVKGAAAIGNLLNQLMELNVMDCNLGDDGVIALASNFTATTHFNLRKLNLCANDITDVSGTFVCNQISHLFPSNVCDLIEIDPITGTEKLSIQIHFVLGLGANTGLGMETTAAVEELLNGRRGFQVALDKADDGSGGIGNNLGGDGTNVDYGINGNKEGEAKFDDMLKKMSGNAKKDLGL